MNNPRQINNHELLSAAMAGAANQITNAINEKLKNIMSTTQAQLDAVIAALPGQIESAVETQLAPIIAQIQQTAAAGGVDLTAEVTALNAIPAAVAGAVASAVTPPAPTPAPAAS